MVAAARLDNCRRQTILVYGAAHFGKSLFWNTSSLLFAFFLTETVGLTPKTMSLILAGSLVFNACADFWVGRALSDRVISAAAAARTQWFGGLVAAAAFSCFSVSGMVPEEYQIAFAVITILLFRLGYSFYDVPQNAYMAFAASSDPERAALASTRYVAAGASILLISLIFAPVIRDSDAERQALRFVQLALALSFVSVMCSGALVLVSRNEPVRARRTAPSASPNYPARKDNVYPLILAAIFCLSLTAPAFTKLEAYFTAYALEHPLSIALFMACAASGKVVSQPFWAHFAAKTSLTIAFRSAAVCWALSAFLLFLFGRIEPWGAIASAFFVGAASGGIFMSLWSLLARASASNPSMTTRRFGLFTFVSKSAQAISILILGSALSQFDYRSAGDAHTLTGIMAGLPLCGALALSALSISMNRRSRATNFQQPSGC